LLSQKFVVVTQNPFALSVACAASEVEVCPHGRSTSALRIHAQCERLMTGAANSAARLLVLNASNDRK
jgi:hypothetical protein